MTQSILRLGLAVAAVALLSAGSASAQTVTATANAEIMAALTLTEDVELNFGTIANAPGIVTVTQAGVQTCPATTCTNGLAGDFSVTGAAGATLDITVDPNITLDDGGLNTMGATTDAPATVTLDGAGNGQFNIGGALTVGVAQAEGVYSGNYSVSVAYP